MHLRRGGPQRSEGRRNVGSVQVLQVWVCILLRLSQNNAGSRRVCDPHTHASTHLCIRQRRLLHAAQQLQLQVTRGPGGVAGWSQQWQELLAQQGEGGTTGSQELARLCKVGEVKEQGQLLAQQGEGGTAGAQELARLQSVVVWGRRPMGGGE